MTENRYTLKLADHIKLETTNRTKGWRTVRLGHIAVLVASSILCIFSTLNGQTWLGLLNAVLVGGSVTTIFWCSICIEMSEHLDAMIDRFKNLEIEIGIEDATGITPHRYTPDHQAMGDCQICGHPSDRPWHQMGTLQ